MRWQVGGSGLRLPGEVATRSIVGQRVGCRSGGVLHERDALALVVERATLIVGEVAPAAVLALVLRGQGQSVVDDDVAGNERKRLAAAARRTTGCAEDKADRVRRASGTVIHYLGDDVPSLASSNPMTAVLPVTTRHVTGPVKIEASPGKKSPRF
jgi:hypothetical protein